MNKAGPIIVIEDDLDDQEILTHIFSEHNYSNEVIFFSDGNKALEYLHTPGVRPFLILSDINMPKINGFEIRNKLQNSEAVQESRVPYLFFTTSSSKKAINEAYSMSVQGFFVKPCTVDELKGTIKKIVDYWQECSSPSEYA